MLFFLRRMSTSGVAKSPDIIQQIYLRQLQMVLNPNQPPPPQPYIVATSEPEEGYRIPPLVLSETVNSAQEDTVPVSSKKKAMARGRKQ